MGRIIKNILGFIQRLFFFIRLKDGIYVINYHGTPLSVMENFEKHLDYYTRHFEMINPDQFETLPRENKKSRKPFLLLTFDDGMKNNIHAIKALEKRNIKAIFFVIPAFIESENPEIYLSSVIRPGYTNPAEKDPEDFQPMSLQDLKAAITHGHAIGSHTYSHTLIKTDNEDKSSFEIIESGNYIKNKLNTEVPYFCSINNTSLSVGPVQQNLIKSHYKYHFTTFYGNNNPPAPFSIQRINVESYWNMNELRFAMGGLRQTLFNK